MTKRTLTAAIAAIACSVLSLKAQTNIQLFHDAGKDRGHLTTTIEGFYSDKWGSTFFFVDHDFNSRNASDEVYAPSGTYMEISRALNFWSDTELAPLSLHVEYNGGVYKGYTINNAFLAGVEWFMHNADFSNTLTLQAMYKHINYHGSYDPAGKKYRSRLPLQLTAVWGMQDLFGVKGLSFSGFADFWWEGHTVYPYLNDKGAGYRDFSYGKRAEVVFLAEPQVWYNVGRHIGVDNLHIGSEIELSYNFGTGRGFFARPCFGAKWAF